MDDIINYREKAMLIVFCGKHEERLDSLRFRIFYQKVAGSIIFVKPENIPPTSAATKYH